MLTEDAFNAVPADARCDRCRHYTVSARSGKTWCELIARRVKPDGWCGDYEPNLAECLKHRKNA